MPKTNYDHVDDWLDAPTTDERELPAKMWLEKFRAPAYKQDAAWLAVHALTCLYQGIWHRVVGCSRLGDVWLSVDLDNVTGYDCRVSINECSKWTMCMTDGSAVDMHSPWRITKNHEIVGNFIPTVVDSCNRTVWAAHTYAGVYEHIVALHNASLKPFVSEWEDLDEDDDAEIPSDAAEHDDPMDDRRIAHSEGWDLYDVDTTGILEIQRDDEAAKFATDDEAVAFVRTRAAAGSPYHRKVMAIHTRHSLLASLHRGSPLVEAYLEHHDYWERLCVAAKRQLTYDLYYSTWSWHSKDDDSQPTGGFETRIHALYAAVLPILLQPQTLDQ